MRREAFTLIELLVVITIIAIMIAILIPQLSRARGIARQALCGSNLRQTGVSFASYMEGNRNWVPRIAGQINEVTAPQRQTVSFPILASTATDEINSLFPAHIRFCPSYGFNNPNLPHRWTYVSPLLNNNQFGQQWTEYLLWNRTTPDDAYVLLRDTYLLETDGSDFRFYANNRKINPIHAFPLMADMLQTNAAGTPRRAAPHNPSGNAYSTDTRSIDSEGSNHLWIDGSVQWKRFPDNAKIGVPAYNTEMRQYPFERASGLHPEGWSAAGNMYYIHYFWVKQSR
jgi:prepilin-type N-terminal cleavage/methylation domain-containing protein